MKKTTGYTINHETKTITITRDFAKRSGIINSDEYRALTQFRKDYSDYTIKNRTASTNKNKNTHNGLTIPFMRKFIGAQENATATLKEFDSVKSLYEEHPAYYSKVKAWFLSKYPNYNKSNPAAPAQILENTTDETAA
ncbi:hypothetical protein LJC32_00905 [Oscillospiraceae bacterium OttesenSCG-928-F05]|nr:hypothetical protein [Oscillospiraceae bacterium OttesenSCG-928-F05]